MQGRFLCGAIVFSSLALGALAASADPQIDAELVDAEANAAKGDALIKVAVTGIELVDADEAGTTPRSGEGHLHYQVDDGPVIATSAKKLAFHSLESGTHRVEVALVGNDHKALGPQETVTLTVPSIVIAH